MQKFKGDDLENKFIAVAGELLDNLSVAKDDFYANAYSAAPLGDLIQALNNAPLSTAIKSEIFRATFNTLFNSFITSGTFETYISVFKEIFGNDVEITFTVPAAGKLTIAIVAVDLDEDDLLYREIVDDAYVYDGIIDQASETIAVQVIHGFESQYELTQMLFEMVPGGVYTTITLTL